jgi:hypothetical protein
MEKEKVLIHSGFLLPLTFVQHCPEVFPFPVAYVYSSENVVFFWIMDFK